MSRTNYTSLLVGGLIPGGADVESVVTRFEPITEAQRDAIPNPVNGMLVYNSDSNLIDGYIDGAWPIPSGESIVIAHEDAWVQTRTQGAFANTGTNTGTVITPLDITITPSKTGNKAIVEFIVFGEVNNSGSEGFVITRNGTLLADASDGSNNQYAVTSIMTFDNQITSTPMVTIVRLIDENTLNISSTYSVLFRMTGVATRTFNLNRSVNSPGSGAETGVSTARIIEYVT